MSELDKVNAARTVFSRCFFDTKRTKEGLHHLKNWQYEVKQTDARTGQITHTGDKPRHDEHSHAGNAFCYFGVASGMSTGRVECKIGKPKSTMLGTVQELLGIYPRSDDGTGWLGR